MHLFRGRHNLKFEIEAIWFHHNLKWVNLKLCLHLKRDIFWRKNTEYKSFIHQEHFTVGIFAMLKTSLTKFTKHILHRGRKIQISLFLYSHTYIINHHFLVWFFFFMWVFQTLWLLELFLGFIEFCWFRFLNFL